MSKQVDYGKLTKKIVFTDSDHRHAQLIIRLRHDGISQSVFFRNIITGYIEGDERIQAFVDEFKKQSQSRKSKSKRLTEKGKEVMKDLNLTDKEVTDIFDIIAEEHPEL